MVFLTTWSTITSAMTDADSPLDVTLMEGVRQNLIHVYEWIGQGYTPSTAHNHNGVNSANVILGINSVGSSAIIDAAISQGKMGTSSIGQGQLKTTTGAVSTEGNTHLTLPGGTYGFYPQIKQSGGTGFTFMIGNSMTGTSYATLIYISDQGGGGIGYAEQRYIQASPPYKIGDTPWGHFLFLLRNIADGKIIASYEAEDPPWAYNGKIYLAKDDPARISEVSHPFADYRIKDPAIDGLEIVLVNLNAINVKQWKTDNEKIGKGILEDLGSVIIGKGKDKTFSNYSIPTIDNFTNKLKVVEP